jgi:hypothetical protein
VLSPLVRDATGRPRAAVVNGARGGGVWVRAGGERIEPCGVSAREVRATDNVSRAPRYVDAKEKIAPRERARRKPRLDAVEVSKQTNAASNPAAALAETSERRRADRDGAPFDPNSSADQDPMQLSLTPQERSPMAARCRRSEEDHSAQEKGGGCGGLSMACSRQSHFDRLGVAQLRVA